MKMKSTFMIMALLALALVNPPGARAEEMSREEMQKAIAALQAEVARLKADSAAGDRLVEIERRVDVLAAEIEKSRTGGAADAEALPSGEPGLGPAASKIYGK